MLPETLRLALEKHLKRVRLLWEADVRAGIGEVYLPEALARKYPNAALEWGQQWVSPSRSRSRDPRSGKMRRHHVQETGLQRAVKARLTGAFVSEAWSKFAKKDEKLDLTKAPSEYKDREEVVIMMGETRHFNKQRIFPMERTQEGQFKGFGEERQVESDNVKGRFSNFIPPYDPDDETRDLAKEALRRLGVAVAKERSQQQFRGRF